MGNREVLITLALLLRAFEDGKLTGKELKQILSVAIPDDLEFSIEEVSKVFKEFLKKL